MQILSIIFSLFLGLYIFYYSVKFLKVQNCLGMSLSRKIDHKINNLVKKRSLYFKECDFQTRVDLKFTGNVQNE